jgi:hypothetical protein
MLRGKTVAIESLGYSQDDASDYRGNPATPQPLQDWWHYSIFWRDPDREAGCPCPKGACGYVESGREVPTCLLHGTMARQQWNFTSRSGHPSRLCVQYVRPMTPNLRHAARILPAQIARLRRHGLFVPIYQPVEHPSLIEDDPGGPDASEEYFRGEDD